MYFIISLYISYSCDSLLYKENILFMFMKTLNENNSDNNIIKL